MKLGIPNICHFWYAAALFLMTCKKYAKKGINLHQNSQNEPKFCVLGAKRTPVRKKGTVPPVVTNISYEAGELGPAIHVKSYYGSQKLKYSTLCIVQGTVKHDNTCRY